MSKSTNNQQADGPTCPTPTKAGKPCQGRSRESGYCFAHDPATKDKREAARVKGGENSSHAARLEKLLPSHLRSTFDRLEAAMKQVHEGSLDPRRATAMASLAGAMVKIIKAGEEEAPLAPQFIVDNLKEWYADLRSIRQMKPRLEMDKEEVDALEEELDAFEAHYGRNIKRPKEVL